MAGPPTSRAPSHARPTREDPVLRWASEAVGGPAGRHHAPHPWWTPVRVVLAITTVVLALGLVQKTPCAADGWTEPDAYEMQCYSDLPHAYTGNGLAELTWPWLDTQGRFAPLDEPTGVNYLAFATAVVTHALAGWPDVVARGDHQVDDLPALEGMEAERTLFTAVNAVTLAGLALVAAALLAGVRPGRPYDALAFGAAPVLLFTGYVAWTLLAVVFVCAALRAWSRERPGAAGAMIGLAAASAAPAVLLLPAAVILAVRLRRWAGAGAVTASAVATWGAVQAPAWATGGDRWEPWPLGLGEGPGLGSLWIIGSQAGGAVAPVVITVTWVATLAGAFGLVGVLVWRSPAPPTLAQVALLLMVAWFVAARSFTPQDALLLLPLAAMARPVWRDLLVWQGAEVVYFVMVWLMLGDELDQTTGPGPVVYWAAILLRIGALLWLASRVVGDLLDPSGRRSVEDRAVEQRRGEPHPDVDLVADRGHVRP